MYDNLTNSYNSRLEALGLPALSEFYGFLVQQIEHYTILYYNPFNLDCYWRQLQFQAFGSRPQFVWQSLTPYAQLKEHYNSEIFVLACLSIAPTKDFTQLMPLINSLSHLREVRVLIEVAAHKENVYVNTDAFATDLLSYCLQQGMLNVLLYFQHLAKALQVYSFAAFPYFQLVKRCFQRRMQLYVSQLANMHGSAIRALPDQSEPNTLLYRDASGELQVTGYLWKFIAAFAAKHKATLELVQNTFRIQRSHSHIFMLEQTANGTADVAVTLQIMPDSYSRSYHQYSHFIGHGGWCIMLPIEQPITVRHALERVLNFDALLLLVACLLLYDSIPYVLKWLRKPSKRTWYVAPFGAIALFLLCAFQAQLHSLIIARPRYAAINSFDALLKSQLRIFGMSGEFYFLDGAFRARYATAFQLTNNASELHRLRRNFNTTYGYTITTMKWELIAAQQRHFAHPLFRFSDELCLYPHMPGSMLLHEESIYHSALATFALQTHQSGLLLHWLRHSLYDMVTAGRMHIEDYSKPRPLERLNMQDYRSIFASFGFGLLLASLMFVLELLRFYLKMFLDRL